VILTEDFWNNTDETLLREGRCSKSLNVSKVAEQASLKKITRGVRLLHERRTVLN
jgi:hypothetical protein